MRDTNLSAEPNSHQAIITREFEAPRALVYRCYSEPELLKQWLGPRNYRMTVPQWEALGERGRAGIPKDRQLVFLGMMFAANDPERNREFLAIMPLAARIAWKLLGRRTFTKEYRKIYGTDPV